MPGESSGQRILDAWERARASWHRPQLPPPSLGESGDGQYPFTNYQITVDEAALCQGGLYLENLFEHLIVHYVFCPRSLETAAELALAAHRALDGPDLARARRMVNVFSDIVVDSFRLERSQEDEEKVLLGWRRLAQEEPSTLDAAVLGFLEAYWEVDLYPGEAGAGAETDLLRHVFSPGVRDRSLWPRQCGQMTRILAGLDPGKLGRGPVRTVEMARGSAKAAPLSALAGELEPDEYRGALEVVGLKGELKRWYRDQGYSIEIRPSIKARESWYPSSPARWRLTDPPSELDVAYSMSLCPRLIPGVTTFKRDQERCEMVPGREAVPDLLVVLDSSRSMDGHSRGTKTHSATLAAFKACQFAHGQGAELAAINFSDRKLARPWTRDLGTVEDLLVEYLGGMTQIPGREIRDMAVERPGCLILCITDTRIQNLYTEWDYLREASEISQFVLFCIDEAGRDVNVDEALRGLGSAYSINRPEDLVALVVDTTKEAYRRGKVLSSWSE